MGEKSKAALSDVKLYQSGASTASTASPASTASAASDCVRLRQLNFWRERLRSQRGRAWAFSGFLVLARYFLPFLVSFTSFTSNSTKLTKLKDRTRDRTRVGRWRSQEKAMAPRTKPLASISRSLQNKG